MCVRVCIFVCVHFNPELELVRPVTRHTSSSEDYQILTTGALVAEHYCVCVLVVVVVVVVVNLDLQGQNSVRPGPVSQPEWIH